MGRRFEPDGAHVVGLEEVHQSGDYLTHEKLWIQALRDSMIEYRNGYFLFDKGHWRGFEWEDVREQSLAGRSLVIGHCDNDVSTEMLSEIFHRSQPHSVFATNLTADGAQIANVWDLPLGIPNDERQSKTHIVQADHTLVKKAWRRGNKPTNPQSAALYAKFSVRNNPRVMGPALEQISAIPVSRIGGFVLSKRGRLTDLVAMRESGLVVCPRGAGMDTHRFWECLLVGAVPVVLRSDHSARLAQQWKLPVIAVDGWSDLKDRVWLENEWGLIQDREWDMSLLTASYWRNAIRNSTHTK